MLFLLILGCTEPLIEEVQISGTLTELDDSNAAPVEGGIVETFYIWDEEFGCAEADEAGQFTVRAPSSSSFFVGLLIRPMNNHVLLRFSRIIMKNGRFATNRIPEPFRF